MVLKQLEPISEAHVLIAHQKSEYTPSQLKMHDLFGTSGIILDSDCDILDIPDEYLPALTNLFYDDDRVSDIYTQTGVFPLSYTRSNLFLKSIDKPMFYR